jgi:hypothetical protein
VDRAEFDPAQGGALDVAMMDLAVQQFVFFLA